MANWLNKQESIPLSNHPKFDSCLCLLVILVLCIVLVIGKIWIRVWKKNNIGNGSKNVGLIIFIDFCNNLI